MNLQQMADAAASILKENLLTLPDLTPIPVVSPPLPIESPLRATYERLWVSFKPDGWEPDMEANFILPAAHSLARAVDKYHPGKVQFACPDDAFDPKAKIGVTDDVIVVASVKDGRITLATMVANA